MTRQWGNQTTPPASWKQARSDRMREGAALMRELTAAAEASRRHFQEHRCYGLASDAADRIRKLEALHGLLLEIAADELLDW